MTLANVDPIVWLGLAWALGVAVRVLWPFFLARSKVPQPFDWNYMIGQVFGAFLGLLPTIAAAGFADRLGALGLVGAFAFGYGGASFGRNGQKSIQMIRG